MATEITHIVFADKIFDKYFSDKNRYDFYLGACYPDIRQLDKNIKRTQTHLKVENIEEVIAETDSFSAGILFHNLTDHRRNQFIESQNHLKKYQTLPYFTESLKLLEDEMLYGQVKDWLNIAAYFSDFDPSKYPIKIKSDRSIEYFQIFARYFTQPPSDQTRQTLIRSFGFPEEVVGTIKQTIQTLRANPAVIDTIEEMYEKIEEIITE